MEMSKALVGPNISPYYISIAFAPLHFKCYFPQSWCVQGGAKFAVFPSMKSRGFYMDVRPNIGIMVCLVREI